MAVLTRFKAIDQTMDAAYEDRMFFRVGMSCDIVARTVSPGAITPAGIESD